MKFPNIETLKRETLYQQYDKLHDSIIWCKKEGHFHFKCFLDLQDEVLEIQGQTYRASKFDKFIHEFQNNLETQLLAFKMMMFKDMDKKIAGQEAVSKAEDNLFKNLHTRITKNGGNLPRPSSKTVKGADGRTYEISKDAKFINV